MELENIQLTLNSKLPNIVPFCQSIKRACSNLLYTGNGLFGLVISRQVGTTGCLVSDLHGLAYNVLSQCEKLKKKTENGLQMHHIPDHAPRPW